jgi:hypothetical protein
MAGRLARRQLLIAITRMKMTAPRRSAAAMTTPVMARSFPLGVPD